MSGDVSTTTCFLSRHPIFDRDKTVYGHDIAARSCLTGETPVHADVEAFSWLVSDGAPELQTLLEESGRLFIFVPDAMLDAPEVHLLPMEYCELVVSPAYCERENLPELLAFLHDFGYAIALRMDGDCQEFEALLPYARTVILDLDRMPPLEIAKQRKYLKKFPVKAMAGNVDTWEAFAGCRALGFELFQGGFFGRPEIVKGRKLAANALTRMELMKVLQDEDSTFKDMGAIIAKDAFLSYRLLRYVNSPGLGLGRAVSSIEHAVAILGDTAFKHWATMALVASLDATPKGEELAYLSLQRGAFLEKLAARATSAPLTPKTMFLLGLFSLLDAMLGQPMAELVADMPMDPRIKAALCGEANSLAPWLKLVHCVDQNRWCDVGEILKGQQINRNGAARDYLDAARWARICFKAATENPEGATM